jgi:hypothetical protein
MYADKFILIMPRTMYFRTIEDVLNGVNEPCFDLKGGVLYWSGCKCVPNELFAE